jgi:molybdopterin molybdotransferase
MFGAIDHTRMLGLPGNPVSALVCATIFLAPAIGAMLGLEHQGATERHARLAAPLGENDEREDYLRATLRIDDDGTPHATPLARQDSSVFSGLARADCLVIRAPFAPAAKIGDPVRILPLGGGGLSI